MEFLSIDFLSALVAIVIIDLALAGDNAIVIALAARNVPRHLQKQAIAWGAVGAVVVRSSMTAIVVWLLNIPGLLFIGGALLVWIAYRLLLPEELEDEETNNSGIGNFWGAMRTIVIADTVMGLDNVLAVAGAAHGSYVLVVLGLLISIPIVVLGSTLILHWVERYPAFVYLGAGVIAWTAVKMIVAEPMLAEHFITYRFMAPLLFLIIVPGVLWIGFVKNHRRIESRISARLTSIEDLRSPGTVVAQGESMRVLVPVDGSRNAELALRHAIKESCRDTETEIHLLNVQPPFSRHIASFLSKKNRDDFHRDAAHKALHSARQILDSLNVPYTVHIEVRDRAEAIAATAEHLRCHLIVMGTARKNSLTRMLQDSVTNKVLELTKVPVQIIVGDGISWLERIGIPTAIGAALALLIISSF